ncbi:androgen-dependent TFPI-regulating protein-like isoform X2 [Ischnura elegans]|uniref:androgen-dependent TFPI-regulating protein-like isoform X2 n=1 Tax=Ischnura elegans TaxID=197161 RepID=UPI001ED89C40|nr:androgen-dependent TFPI-regulating protein-like isoform X2 [Ischnura elegans]
MSQISAMIPKIFHVVTWGYYVFVLCYWLQIHVPDNMKVNMPHLRYHWWQYLTVWNLIIQALNVLLCVISDYLDSGNPRKVLLEAKEKLEWTRDTLFQSLTFPLGNCVFVVFWATFAYDRELIYPAGFDAFIPFWYNHVLHTAVVFFPWVEMIICQRPFDELKLRYLYGLAVIAVYNALLITAACVQGFWTYPILGMLTPVQKMLYFLLVYSIFTTLYIVGCRANDKICGNGLSGLVNSYRRKIDKKSL